MKKKFYSKNRMIVKFSIIGSIIIGVVLIAMMINYAVKNILDTGNYSNNYTVVFQCDYNDITQVSIQNSENNVLIKTDDGWECNGNTDIIIGDDEILRFLMNLKRIIGNDVNTTDDNFGFENPSSVVIINMLDGSTHNLTVGKKTDQGYFVKYSGSENVYLLNELNSNVFFSTLNDFRDKDIFAPVTDDVITVSVKNESGDFVVSKYDTENPSKDNLFVSDWQVTSPIRNQCKDEYVIKNLFNNMILKTDGFYKNSSDMYSEYKLDNPICTAVYEYVDGTTKKLTFGEIIDNSVYVKIDGDQFIYKVPSRYLSILSLEYHDLLSSLTDIEKIENVNSIDITYNNVMHSITVERNEGNIEYKCDGKIITKDAFSAVYEKIMSIYIEGNIELSGTGVFVCTISIVYNDGLTNKIIDFYTYENEFAAIIVNGELNYFTSLNKVQSIIDEFEKLL